MAGRIFPLPDYVVCEPLFDNLERAVEELRQACTTTDRPRLCRGKGFGVDGDKGYGIKEAEKNIAADNAISILREIKKIRGW